MILHVCFSHFLSLANGTKSCKVSQTNAKYLEYHLEYHLEHINTENEALELKSYKATLRIDDIKFCLVFSENVLYPGM